MIKILAIVGSNNKNSNSRKLAESILKECNCAFEEGVYTELLQLNEVSLYDCFGCEACFRHGKCVYGQKDDLNLLINKIKSVDIVFWVSPVYMLNVPSCMKRLLDRLAIYSHTMGFAGKVGFILVGSSYSGTVEVQNYLKKVLTPMGFKIAGSYAYIEAFENSEEDFASKTAQDIVKRISLNYGFSNSFLEDAYLNNKYYYITNYDQLSKNNERYEINYWNQDWIKKCPSFQEYAIKIKEHQDE